METETKLIIAAVAYGLLAAGIIVVAVGIAGWVMFDAATCPTGFVKRSTPPIGCFPTEHQKAFEKWLNEK